MKKTFLMIAVFAIMAMSEVITAPQAYAAPGFDCPKWYCDEGVNHCHYWVSWNVNPDWKGLARYLARAESLDHVGQYRSATIYSAITGQAMAYACYLNGSLYNEY